MCYAHNANSVVAIIFVSLVPSSFAGPNEAACEGKKPGRVGSHEGESCAYSVQTVDPDKLTIKEFYMGRCVSGSMFPSTTCLAKRYHPFRATEHQEACKDKKDGHECKVKGFNPVHMAGRCARQYRVGVIIRGEGAKPMGAVVCDVINGAPSPSRRRTARPIARRRRGAPSRPPSRPPQGRRRGEPSRPPSRRRRRGGSPEIPLESLKKRVETLEKTSKSQQSVIEIQQSVIASLLKRVGKLERVEDEPVDDPLPPGTERPEPVPGDPVDDPLPPGTERPEPVPGDPVDDPVPDPPSGTERPEPVPGDPDPTPLGEN